jgi:hypothetical protein
MTDTDIADVSGLAVTAPSAAAVGQFDALIDELYYYRRGVVDRLVELLQDFPDFPLAHVLVGYSLMTEGTLNVQPKARACLRRAEALPANRRERLHQKALQAWLEGDVLARLEFQGVHVGPERWARLAQASLASATQCTLWFTAMHHVMALLRSGQESAANATFRYLESASENSSQAALACELSRAAAAFCQDRPGDALERMLDLRQRHGELGASHAQQDFYDQIMVVAAQRVGDLPRVRQLLKARLSTRVCDSSSWQAFEHQSRLVDGIDDVTAVRDALRWALGEPVDSPGR